MEYSIITPFLCGIIGYATNWLAIKMIFRPFEEKRFLGIKIPFTPSLMAKEKNRMASKIGSVVSDKLITEDIFLDFFKEEATRGFLTEKIKNNIDVQKDKSLYDFFLSLVKDEKVMEDFINQIYSNFDKEIVSSTFSDEIFKILISEEFFNGCSEALKNNSDLLNKELTKLLQNETFANSIKGEFEKFCQNNLDNAWTLEDVLGLDEKEEIYLFIQDNLEVVLENFIKLISSEKFEPIDKELEKLIKVAIVSNLGTFASAFISSDSLYNKNKEKLISYLEDSNNKPEILQYITKILNQIFTVDFLAIITSFEKEKVGHIIDKTLEVSSIRLVPSLEKPFEAFLEKINYNTSILENILNKFGIRDKIYRLILSKYDFCFYKIFNIDHLNRLYVKDFIKDEELFIGGILDILYASMENNAKEVLENLNIDKIIEKNLKDMSLMETEKIVLEVAGRELRSITYFGGVLGFVVGLIPLLLSKI